MSQYNLDEIWYVDYSHLATLLLLSCSCSAPTLLLPSSSFCPAPAVLLPCFFQAPIRHIPSSSPVPAQLLPSFCPALLYSALLCSCPVPALLLPCSCFSPALALLQSCSCPAGPAHPSLAAFIIISTLRLFFATARAAFYGTMEYRAISFIIRWNFAPRDPAGREIRL